MSVTHFLQKYLGNCRIFICKNLPSLTISLPEIGILLPAISPIPQAFFSQPFQRLYATLLHPLRVIESGPISWIQVLYHKL